MAVMSPQFSFAEYWTYAVASGGQVTGPAPGRDVAYNHNKFVYAFRQIGPTNASSSAPWQHVATYALEAPPMVSRTGVPFLRPSIAVNANGENTWGHAEDSA